MLSAHDTHTSSPRTRLSFPEDASRRSLPRVSVDVLMKTGLYIHGKFCGYGETLFYKVP